MMNDAFDLRLAESHIEVHKFRSGAIIAATVLAFFFVANYILSFISLFVLRRREPEKPRPYRAWGYPFTTALALLGFAQPLQMTGKSLLR